MREISEYYKRRENRLESWCRYCCSENSKRWRSENKEYNRDYNLKRLYGVGIDQYYEMYSSRDGRCDICGEHREYGALCVDHCHSTSRVRGLLCNICNLVLGQFKDNPILFKSAIEYLLN
jgi:hypothetical protein